MLTAVPLFEDGCIRLSPLKVEIINLYYNPNIGNLSQAILFAYFFINIELYCFDNKKSLLILHKWDIASDF